MNMAEYIEREALLEKIRLKLNQSSLGETSEPYMTWQNVVQLILEANAADVVEVVRCLDCKYISDPTGRGNFLCGRKMLGFVRPDDFCSFGARMDGDKDAH